MSLKRNLSEIFARKKEIEIVMIVMTKIKGRCSEMGSTPIRSTLPQKKARPLSYQNGCSLKESIYFFFTKQYTSYILHNNKTTLNKNSTHEYKSIHHSPHLRGLFLSNPKSLCRIHVISNTQ